jgi:hypothetical protein
MVLFVALRLDRRPSKYTGIFNERRRPKHEVTRTRRHDRRLLERDASALQNALPETVVPIVATVCFVPSCSIWGGERTQCAAEGGREIDRTRRRCAG